MKVIIGLILVVALVSSLFTSIVFAETKSSTNPKYKTKTTVKKDAKEIQKPSEDKTVKIIKIIKSRTLSILYIVGIEICAGKERLYSPELDLKSDRDSMTVKVWGLIMPKTCKTTEFFIRANNPDSISVIFSKSSYRDYPRTS